jgi:hypothetical protein
MNKNGLKMFYYLITYEEEGLLSKGAIAMLIEQGWKVTTLMNGA